MGQHTELDCSARKICPFRRSRDTLRLPGGKDERTAPPSLGAFSHRLDRFLLLQSSLSRSSSLPARCSPLPGKGSLLASRSAFPGARRFLARCQFIRHLFPRFCRARSFLVNARSFVRLLTGELIPCEALTNDLADGKIEPLSIIHAFAIVIAEHLLIEISEQVERLDRNVGSLQAALEQGPEVLQSVGVNFAVTARDFPPHNLRFFPD